MYQTQSTNQPEVCISCRTVWVLSLVPKCRWNITGLYFKVKIYGQLWIDGHTGMMRYFPDHCQMLWFWDTSDRPNWVAARDRGPVGGPVRGPFFKRLVNVLFQLTNWLKYWDWGAKQAPSNEPSKSWWTKSLLNSPFPIRIWTDSASSTSRFHWKTISRHRW